MVALAALLVAGSSAPQSKSLYFDGQKTRRAMSGVALLVIVAVVVLLIILEGKRQERKYGKPKGGNLLGAGMLELQRILEPERKVEILREEQEVDERAVSGDPPEAGKGS